MRWSFSFSLPLEYNLPASTLSTIVGENIWIAINGYVKTKNKMMDLLVFDTEKDESTVVKCKWVEEETISIEWLGSWGNTLYMFVKRIVNNGRMTACSFYKMETNSNSPLEWKMFFDLGFSIYISNILINKDQIFYTVDGTLHTIDLTSKSKTTSRLKEILICNSFLYSSNEELYLMEHFDNGHRTVSLIEQGKLITIAKDKREVGKSNKVCKQLLTDSKCTILYYIYNSEKAVLETFDFESKKWTRRDFEWPYWRTTHDLCRIDDKVYTFLGIEDKDRKFEMRVLELYPKLLTICLMNIVDGVIPTKPDNVDEMEQLIPINLRKQLKNMIHWKSAELENKQRLLKAQKIRKEQEKRFYLEEYTREVKRKLAEKQKK